MKHLPLLLAFMTIHHCLLAQKRGQALIDSLQARLEIRQHDTSKARLLYTIAYAYSDIDPDKGLEYGNKARQLSEKAEWPRGMASANSSLGVNYKALSDYKAALKHYLTALDIFRLDDDKNGESGILSNISLIYLDQGDYAKALEYAFDAVKLKEETGDKINIAAINANIGNIYLRQKDYDKTMEYFTRALNIYEEIGNKAGVALTLGNIGIVYNEKENYAKALEYLLKAKNINETLGYKNSVQINLANIGIAHTRLRSYPEALRSHEEALEISEEIKSRSGIAINHGNIGSVYFSMATDSVRVLSGAAKGTALQNSISHLEHAISICREINFSGPLVEFNQLLSDAYALAGNYKKSLAAYKEYISMKDSLYSVQSRSDIISQETKREMDLREKDLLIKEKQLRINELEVARKRNERIIFFISTALLLVLVGISLKMLYDYRRSNRVLLKEKNKYLDEIESQIGRLKKQSLALEEIAHIQSHDIRGPVATILGLTQLFNFEDPADPQNRSVIESVTTVTEQLDRVIKDVIEKNNSLDKELG